MTGRRTLSGAARLRVLLAAAVAAAACLGFLSADTVAERVSGIVASWQLFPATSRLFELLAGGVLTAGTLGALIAVPLVLLSAIFGRWYCAVLCPLGSLQELASWLGRRKRRYRPPARAARAISVVLCVGLTLSGAMVVASWLDPWSIFGRFLSYDVEPLLQLASRADVRGFSPWATAGSAAAMAVIVAMAVFRGRWFCGTLCPVGSVLGLLNRVAPLRVRLAAGSCVACGRCAAVCPASCIDPASRRIDDSRCLSCLSCFGACPEGAIRYGKGRSGLSGGPRMSRAGFLTVLGGGAAALAFSALPGRALFRRLPIPPGPSAPPGARSIMRYLDSCTACGLCVSSCPSKVLRPSSGRLGPRGLFVPALDYSVSYCQYECTRCLDLCPSGALERMNLERKKLVKIGDATLVKERCIVFTAGTKCGACAEHCPTGAVRMTEAPGGIPEPFFTSNICIGCGACHHACPVRPERAISVSGLAVHAEAERPTADLFGSPAGGESPGGTGVDGFPF